MLLVYTDNQEQTARLQEQFSVKEGFFQVPVRESQTVQAIIRSILFEYFQNSTSTIADKIKELVYNSLNMKFSLTLFRDIIALLSREHDAIKMYKKHFLEMNRAFAEGEEDFMDEQYSVEEDNDHLFALAQTGNMRITRNIDTTEFHEEYEVQINYRCPMTKTEKTMQTAIHEYNPQQILVRETLERSTNLSSFFYSAETIYSNQWWKNQKHVNDSSKEISKFERKGINLINQKSIGHLVIEQFKYDLNRQVELAKDIKKHEQLEVFKYNKMMKEKLMSAKLKKRKKK